MASGRKGFSGQPVVVPCVYAVVVASLVACGGNQVKPGGSLGNTSGQPHSESAAASVSASQGEATQEVNSMAAPSASEKDTPPVIQAVAETVVPVPDADTSVAKPKSNTSADLPSNPPTQKVTLKTPPKSSIPVEKKVSSVPKPSTVKTPDQSTSAEKKPNEDRSVKSKPQVEAGVIKKPVSPAADKPAKTVGTGSEAEIAKAASSTESSPPMIEAHTDQTSEAMQLAMVDKPALEVPPAAALNITLDQLPLSLGEGWQLDRTKSPLNASAECQLTKKVTGIDDGYDKSEMVLALSQSGVWFKSTANIDMTYPGVGVRFAGSTESELVDFSEKYSDAGAFLRIAPETIPPDIRAIHILMGFWPTWPVTETRDVAFTLTDFSQLRQALKACAKL